LEQQSRHLTEPEPVQWEAWLPEAFGFWLERWQPALEEEDRQQNPLATELLNLLRETGLFEVQGFRSRSSCASFCQRAITTLDEGLRDRRFLKKHCQPLTGCLADLRLLARWFESNGQAAGNESIRPLAWDWDRMRRPMLALLHLTRRFGEELAARKRERGLLDFADLEQFALDLLWDRGRNQPTDLARRLRQRFRWVFVDEYQDINPAQDLILRALSREAPHGNRFLVGDVKQSIYRFRRADPVIFRKYARDWDGAHHAQVIPLQENFRSHAGILTFVNTVFGALMDPSVGGVDYGPDARLQPGSAQSPAGTGAESHSPPVEVCLWPPRKPGNRSQVEPAESDLGDAEAGELEDLSRAEEEARLVACRLRELREAQWPVRDPGSGRTRPVRYADMAVLLRAPGPKTEIYLSQFEAVGVPLEVPRRGFFDALEVADLLNLLRLLDNPLQDLPLLAVLRSPFVGLTPDEMAWVCARDRNLPVWLRLRRWVNHGDDTGPSELDLPGLRRRLKGFLEKYARWRQLARVESVTRCLEVILSETQYVAWLESLPHGRFRRMHVERCLELARDYDRIQGEGLGRFLRQMEAYQESETEPEVPAEAGADAVRLLSIHQSKGLEFPVVVVADLGKPFNLQDLHAQVLLDEHYGPSSQILSADGRRYHPSLSFWLSRHRQWRENLGEEVRLLYVAFTRARDYLLLTGHVRSLDLSRGHSTSSRVRLLQARTPMDWLLPVLQHNGLPPPGDQATGRTQLFAWRWVVCDSPAATPPGGSDAVPRSAEEPQTSAPAPTPSEDNPWAELLRLRQLAYPARPATVEPAKTSVTAAQRRWQEEERPVSLFPGLTAGRERRFPRLPLTAVERGTAHHRFLRHFNLQTPLTPDGLAAEARRLLNAGLLKPEEVEALDFDALGRFWRSEVGQQILQHPGAIRRELEFTVRMDALELREVVGARAEPELAGEFIIVQGAADLVVVLPHQLWLLDFKTDEVRGPEVESRTAHYAPQLRLYARALERIYARPVVRLWLHFLAAGVTREVARS
jgi:ATP-dependent helicase/nuclease subunit A